MLETVVGPLKDGWEFGIKQASCRLLSIRFVDDIQLVGQTLNQVRSMLGGVARESAKAGLSIQFRKTKIPHTELGKRTAQASTRVADQSVDITTQECSAAYFGKGLSLGNTHQTELNNRVAKAWRAFRKNMLALCDSATRWDPDWSSSMQL